MFNLFNRKASKKANTNKSDVNESVAVKVEEQVPEYTLEQIIPQDIINRAVAIVNGNVAPTMADWEDLRDASEVVYDRIAEIKRNRKELNEMGFAAFCMDIATKASCEEHLLVMAFRKAWYVNNPEEAKKDARHDIIHIADEYCWWFKRAYRDHCKEYGYPLEHDVAYLDLRNDLRPLIGWAIA